MGTYYSVGHTKRAYRSCAATGVYNIAVEPSEQIELLKYAVTRTIDRHPTLCYGIIDKTENSTAQFLQLKTINWEDIAENKTLPSAGTGDSILEYEVGRGHELLFEKLQERPAWRLMILQYENEPQRVDIVCYIHHSIGDGTSGAAIQKTLIQYLQEGSSSIKRTQPAWPYVVPETIPHPVAVEEAYPSALGPEPTTSPEPPSTDPESTFEPWTAEPPSKDPFRSLALILTIPNTNVSSILQYCRERSITLTGLLHGLITIYLANAVPSAKGFRANTPFSMRRFTKFSNDEIVCHVAGISNDWTEDLLASIRSSEEGSAEEERIICDMSAQFQSKAAQAIAEVPEKGAKGLIEASKITDFDKFVDDLMQKKKRGPTYEISNVGVVKLVEDNAEKQVAQLRKLIFSQCGMVAGASFGASVVSIAGGPLCLCITWQEGILEKGFAEGLKSYLERRLLAFV